MGWTGNFIHWTKYDSNKELFLRAYPSYASEYQKGDIKLSEHGSILYMLYKYNDKGVEKYHICAFLTQRNKSRNEFLTKDVGALENGYFDFPESWVKYLDKSNPEIALALERRKQYKDSKKQSKDNVQFGSLFKCTAKREISWQSGYTISEGEDFYVKIGVLNPYARRKTKCFVVVDGATTHCSTGRRISADTFYNGCYKTWLA